MQLKRSFLLSCLAALAVASPGPNAAVPGGKVVLTPALRRDDLLARGTKVGGVVPRGNELFARQEQECLQSDYKPCSEESAWCCPADGTCCKDKSGDIKNCAPAGGECCDDGHGCAAGDTCCGTGCMPSSGAECCADGYYCTDDLGECYQDGDDWKCSSIGSDDAAIKQGQCPSVLSSLAIAGLGAAHMFW